MRFPEPKGATHYDVCGYHYRAMGREVWNGARWIACEWGSADPLEHIKPIEKRNGDQP